MHIVPSAMPVYLSIIYKLNYSIKTIIHLTMLFLAYKQLFDSTSFLDEGNNFQKRRVWSPEPVNMLYSVGDLAK